jgi:hypothetical protein
MFGKNVERWRTLARQWAEWAAARVDVALDEHDILALIDHESKGDPTAISHNKVFWGLGQIGPSALATYNNSGPGHEVPVKYEWLKDAGRGSEQIRVIAWLLADGRKTVSSWSMPDAKVHADLWASVRYSWGGKHLRDAIAEYRVKHGKTPTFAELEAASPAAYDVNKDVRPWHYAHTVHNAAAKDRKEAPELLPFLREWWPIIAIVVVAIVGLVVGAVLIWRSRRVRP